MHRKDRMEEKIQKIQAPNGTKEMVRRKLHPPPSPELKQQTNEFVDPNSAKCFQKKVKLAYHIICEDCATASSVCAKCLKPGSTRQYPTQEEEEKAYLDAALDQMREREKRAFLRQLDRGDDNTRGSNHDENDSGSESIPESDSDDEEDDEVSRTLRAAARRARQLLRGELAPNTSQTHATDNLAEKSGSKSSSNESIEESGDDGDVPSESE
eukprot:TRINITY_DN646_c0_g1_i2.p1 TRINITY_DN646_c0_g1~~TRINITY_DN646_c0_g1_i2.p1  ORF type:complete len:212 (+),score=33.28 TRINITY_DN646_c0_g1_i2:148-783(+)